MNELIKLELVRKIIVVRITDEGKNDFLRRQIREKKSKVKLGSNRHHFLREEKYEFDIRTREIVTKTYD